MQLVTNNSGISLQLCAAWKGFKTKVGSNQIISKTGRMYLSCFPQLFRQVGKHRVSEKRHWGLGKVDTVDTNLTPGYLLTSINLQIVKGIGFHADVILYC